MAPLIPTLIPRTTNNLLARVDEIVDIRATVPVECLDIKLDDIDFLGATTGTEQASKLVRFCSAVNQFNCDIYKIAGYDNRERAQLLEDNANCNLATAELVVYSVTLAICILVILTNTMELVVICHFRKLRTSTNRIIISLACSDMLLGISAVYTTMMNILEAKAENVYNIENLTTYLEIRADRTLCLLLDGPGFIFGCMLLSILTLTAIAVEKYIAIFHPLQFNTLVTSYSIALCMAVGWIFAILFGFLPLMGWNEYDGICQFVEKTSYSYLITWACLCVVCGLLTSCLYVRIFLTARQQARKISARRVTCPQSVEDSLTNPSVSEIAHAYIMHPDFPHNLSPVQKGMVGNDRPRNGHKLSNSLSDLRHKVNSIAEVDEEHHRPVSADSPAQTRPTKMSNSTILELDTRNLSQNVQSDSTKQTCMPRQNQIEPTAGNPVKNILSTPTKKAQNKTRRKGVTRKPSIIDKQTKETQRKISFRLKKMSSRWSIKGLISSTSSKALKTVTIILGSFYACSLPLIFYLLAFPGQYANFTIHCLLLVALLNALLNPLVYGFHNPNMRKAFCKLLSRSELGTSNDKKTSEPDAKT